MKCKSECEVIDMYHFTDKRIKMISVICFLFLWMALPGLTAFGAEVPGGGAAVDGTIRDVDSSEIAKGSEMVSAPAAPGGASTSEEANVSDRAGTPDRTDVSGAASAPDGTGTSREVTGSDAPVSDGPVGSQAPHKLDSPNIQTGDLRVSDAAPAASGSPVLTCGSSKMASLSKEVSDKHMVPKGDSLGMFITTGYCSCEECSAGFSLTYSGTVPRANHTISADISLFPIGTQLIIGDIIYTVEDIGSNVIGTHIDIYYDNHEDAIAHGKQSQEVFTVRS